MKTINDYKKRFYNLMESQLGDAKPLISEQPERPAYPFPTPTPNPSYSNNTVPPGQPAYPSQQQGQVSQPGVPAERPTVPNPSSDNKKEVIDVLINSLESMKNNKELTARMVVDKIMMECGVLLSNPTSPINIER